MGPRCLNCQEPLSAATHLLCLQPPEGLHHLDQAQPQPMPATWSTSHWVMSGRPSGTTPHWSPWVPGDTWLKMRQSALSKPWLTLCSIIMSFTHLDDILIISRNKEEHVYHVPAVFQWGTPLLLGSLRDCCLSGGIEVVQCVLLNDVSVCSVHIAVIVRQK